MTQRIIVFGSNGFVGKSVCKKLKSNGHEIEEISRRDFDFDNEKTEENILNIINQNDKVVLAFAKAPAKDWDMVEANVRIIKNFINAFRKKLPKFILNISSDAIYSDSNSSINEDSLTIPDNPHGTMHFLREKLLKDNLKTKICNIRPTLIYGKDDPHNGYGPNSFLRSCLKEGKIYLFGKGEELRDHIFIDDVADIVVLAISNEISENINAVSGNVVSFAEIAETIKKNFSGKLEIISKPRSGPMPHNGYRSLSNNLAIKLLEKIEYTKLSDYINDQIGNTKWNSIS